MSSNVKRWFYPAQVFAQFTASDEKSAKFVDKQECSPENMSKYTSKDSNNLLTDRDLIQIFETGEMTLAPDFAKVVIVCTSVKDVVEEVKVSVNKRVEYVLQTLRSHSIGKQSYTVDRSLIRSDSKYELQVEISVQFSDFTKCQEVSNLLVEKLDASVTISRPSFHYTPAKLESLRRQVCVLAVQNAKVKAMQIASSLNQTLGEARHIHEISTEEFTGQDIIGRNERKIKSFQELVNSATVTMATKVFVAFELNAQKNKRKK